MNQLICGLLYGIYIALGMGFVRALDFTLHVYAVFAP